MEPVSISRRQMGQLPRLSPSLTISSRDLESDGVVTTKTQAIVYRGKCSMHNCDCTRLSVRLQDTSAGCIANAKCVSVAHLCMQTFLQGLFEVLN